MEACSIDGDLNCRSGDGNEPLIQVCGCGNQRWHASCLQEAIKLQLQFDYYHLHIFTLFGSIMSSFYQHLGSFMLALGEDSLSTFLYQLRSMVDDKISEQVSHLHRFFTCRECQQVRTVPDSAEVTTFYPVFLALLYLEYNVRLLLNRWKITSLALLCYIACPNMSFLSLIFIISFVPDSCYILVMLYALILSFMTEATFWTLMALLFHSLIYYVLFYIALKCKVFFIGDTVLCHPIIQNCLGSLTLLARQRPSAD